MVFVRLYLLVIGVVLLGWWNLFGREVPAPLTVEKQAVSDVRQPFSLLSDGERLLVGEMEALLQAHFLHGFVMGSLLSRVDQQAIEFPNLTFVDWVNSALQTLDVATRYRPRVSVQSGSFGLGVQLFLWNDQTIMVPVRDGPAFEHGLTDVAQLLAVAKRSVVSLSQQEIGERIDAAFADKKWAVFLVAKMGRKKNSTLRLRRQPYSRTEVEWWPLRFGAIKGSLRILDFVAGKTASVLRDHFLSVDATQPVVIDLRFATGGDLHEALDSASLFIPAHAPLAFTENRNRERVTYVSLESSKVHFSKIFLLIGPQTASAAEIFAQAMAANLSTVYLVGRVTYGKCTSQRVFPLSDGGVLRLTNLRILDASQQDCRGVGILPHTLVPAEHIYDTNYIIKNLL